MRRLLATVLTAGLTLVLALLGSPASATPVARAEASAPTLTLTGDTSVTALRPVPATVTLRQDGAPVSGAPVSVERYQAGAWRPVATATTGSDGTAQVSLRVGNPGRYPFRARYAGPGGTVTSAQHVITVSRRTSTIGVRGPASLVDETSTTLSVAWFAEGLPVQGTFTIQSHRPGQPWSTLRSATTDAEGRATFTVAPRWDTYIRVVGSEGTWWRSDASASHFLDNRPPGTPVTYPSGAPSPQGLPARPRAYGAGANITATTIPSSVWNQMTGISWRSGCPVGRSSLRLLRINYWGFNGYRYRGVMVVNADVVQTFARAFRGLYAERVPIRAMWLVDRFGYSSRSGGGNDFAAMEHDNTSAFNCRWVTGNPGTRSPHSYGRSLDINTWQNPYNSKVGWLPNTWWPYRSHPRLAWRDYEHTVVKVFTSAGFRWTYGVQDSQHFDVPAGAGRRALYSEDGFPLD